MLDTNKTVRGLIFTALLFIYLMSVVLNQYNFEITNFSILEDLVGSTGSEVAALQGIDTNPEVPPDKMVDQPQSRPADTDGISSFTPKHWEQLSEEVLEQLKVSYQSNNGYKLDTSTFTEYAIKYKEENINLSMNRQLEDILLHQALQDQKDFYKINCTESCKKPHAAAKGPMFSSRTKVRKQYYEKSATCNKEEFILKEIFEKDFDKKQEQELEEGLEKFIDLQPNLKKILEIFSPGSTRSLSKDRPSISLHLEQYEFKDMPIPLFYHFIEFGCFRRFTIFNFIAAMSVLRFGHKDARIFFHKSGKCRTNPKKSGSSNNNSTGPTHFNWFGELKKIAGDRLVIVVLDSTLNGKHFYDKGRFFGVSGREN